MHSVLFGEESTSEILFLSPTASKCSLTTVEHQVLIFGFEELAGPGCLTSDKEIIPRNFLCKPQASCDDIGESTKSVNNFAMD